MANCRGKCCYYSERKTLQKYFFSSENIATTKLAEKDITKLVGTNKKGFKRKLKRLQAKQSVATLKDKKVKSADGESNCQRCDKCS